MANFMDLVKEMALRNNISMKPDKDIDFADLDITALNAQAEKLSADVIPIFLYGDHEITAKIISKYEIALLDKTLDQIFGDDLYYNFYKD